jgi:uncharacterized protein
MGNIKKVLIEERDSWDVHNTQVLINEDIEEMRTEGLDVEILISSQGGGVSCGTTYWTIIGREK